MNIAVSLFRRSCINEVLNKVLIYNNPCHASREGLILMFRRWATKKTASYRMRVRNPKPKDLGVKKCTGARVVGGQILVRQRGMKWRPGNYVGIGREYTLYALKPGIVRFQTQRGSNDVRRQQVRLRKFIHIDPEDGHVLYPIFKNPKACETNFDVPIKLYEPPEQDPRKGICKIRPIYKRAH